MCITCFYVYEFVLVLCSKRKQEKALEKPQADPDH